MNFVEVEVNVLLILVFALMCMCLIAAISSSGKEKVAKDAYDLGYEMGRQAERKIALNAIDKYTKQLKESVENIFEQKHEDFIVFDKIAEEIKEDAKC